MEAEIGDIGTGSEIHVEAPDLSKGLTTPVEARQFVESMGVDILAPAVGSTAREADEPVFSLSLEPPSDTVGTIVPGVVYAEADFYYEREALPGVCIFCDCPDHDQPARRGSGRR